MKRSKSESPVPGSSRSFVVKAKRSRLSPSESDSPRNQYIYQLLDLPDDVLLHIFKFVSTFDLMSLHLTCPRLSLLCCDRSLCTRLDLRDRHVPVDELLEYTRFMKRETTFLGLRGNKKRSELPRLDFAFLYTTFLKCPQLRHFILEDYVISREEISINHFPRSIKILSLKGCQVLRKKTQKSSYLYSICTHMRLLTTLILTNCNWLDSHSFMAISKVPFLREVRMNSCHGLTEEVAYASLACRYGLRSLEIMDLRDTFIGDSVVSSFSHTKSLTEILLECPGEDTVQQLSEEYQGQREVVFVRLQDGPEVVYQDNHVAVELINEGDLNELIENIGSARNSMRVSDRSICALGQCLKENSSREIIHDHNGGEVQLIINGRPRVATNPNLKKLVIRNYEGITNQTLNHFLVNGPKLEYLDVTGTAVTKEALVNFRIQRPNVRVISSFDD